MRRGLRRGRRHVSRTAAFFHATVTAAGCATPPRVFDPVLYSDVVVFDPAAVAPEPGTGLTLWCVDASVLMAHPVRFVPSTAHFNLVEVLDDLSDRKDKLVSRLYMRKLEELFVDEGKIITRCANCGLFS